MNPNASEFVFRAAAPEFVPPGMPRAPVVVPPPAPAAVPTEGEGDDEDIDENDPLWKAVLAIAEGDKERATKMLEDPDSLMKYPECRAIIEGGSGEDDWEKGDTITSAAEAPAAAAVVVVAAAAAPTKSPTKAAAPAPAPKADDDDVIEDTGIVEESDPREHLNLVFIGHVDAGKSTLSGSILYIMGKVDQRTIERYEREAKQRNRESWFLAFIMDTSEEERAKGKTVEVGRAHFETDTNRYTILDAPGHKNYVPNMISGAAQADVGILVISARKGEFETGFEKGGQTREHALLAKTLGVQFLVVVINKMDDPTVEWDQGRYEECVGKLKPYLKQCGYVIKTDVKFVPISGLSGDNVLKEVPAEKCPWWKQQWTTGAHNTTQPSLLTILDALKLQGRNPNAPLRIPCLDRYLERGCVVLGKVESGTIRMDDTITIAPTKKTAKVEAIYIGDSKVRSAKPGESVLVKFNINVEDIQKGYVLSSPQSPCPAVVEVRVQLALVDLLEYRPLFSPGYEAVMHVHTVEVEVVCCALVSVVVKGKPVKRPFALQGQVCIAHLSMTMSTCMETFENMPSMARVTLRDEGKTIAIGKIVKLIK